ncbi:MAG TPA: hypothetical protein CFH81_04795 [Sulfurovum sp. UBA12169]|nr:MAG TPA: hypothetical protein CFH81_04795 [Sulfurovum sp. UBA12169]
MKKFLIPALVVAIIVGIIATVFTSMVTSEKMVTVKEGNMEKKPLEIILGKYQDSDCGMVVESLEFASQIITNDGKTRFFHDIGGMANYLKDKSFKNEVVIWVYTKDTNEWIDGKAAWYSTNEITPMSYGFGAYKNKNGDYITYEEMNLRVLRGETLQNPKLRKKALGY